MNIRELCSSHQGMRVLNWKTELNQQMETFTFPAIQHIYACKKSIFMIGLTHMQYMHAYFSGSGSVFQGEIFLILCKMKAPLAFHICLYGLLLN